MIHLHVLSRTLEASSPIVLHFGPGNPTAPEVRHMNIGIGRPTIASGYNDLVRATPTPDPRPDDILGFLHDDARILFDAAAVMPGLFARAAKPGVLGFIGCEVLPRSGWWWEGAGLRGALQRGPWPVENGKPNFAYGTPWRNGLCPVQSVDGFAMFIRRDVFDKIGGFTEYGGWHLYDADLCLKAHEAGLQNYVVDALAHHLETGNLFGTRPWADTQLKFQARWFPKKGR